MLTQEQKSTICGYSVFEFQTQIGFCGEVVDCLMSYEYDSSGIYNNDVTQVIYKGIDIMPCLSEEQIGEIDILGLQLLEQSKTETF